MKHLLSTLLASAVCAITAAVTTPAFAQSTADYRAYCQDDDYYERYQAYCSRFDRDGDRDYDDNDADDDGDQGAVRDSNYNHNRTYLPGYRSGDNDSAERSYGDQRDGDDDEDDDDAGYDPQSEVPGRNQGNTGGYGQGNDSNSYTGQRSTTH